MNKKYTYLIIIFLIVASCAAFGRIAGNDFINFDDVKYITENNNIKSGINTKSIIWAFSSVEFFYWQPLTWLSHMLDWSLFKEQAGGRHLISLLLHIGSGLLLFFFLYRTTKNIWPSAFTAALFSLHPLRVESVAWAAERKDVLSMFFGIASIYAYALYAESSKLSRYFLCLILFSLSLMAKPMMVTVPFVLLLLDYWPLGRWQKALTPVEVPIAATERAKKKKTKNNKADIINEEKISTPLTSNFPIIRSLLWEKVPFIFLAIVSSIVTFWGQHKFGIIITMKNMPFSLRIQNAVISYFSYLGKIFWPVDLAVFYPYEYLFPFWQILASCFILIGITIVVIYAIKKMPFLFVGWFWYLGTLIPVIGLVQVASQAMADRFTYLPSIGIIIMLVWGIPLLFPRKDMRKKILFPAGIASIAILTVLTWQQCGYWKNSIALFNHALQVTKNNSFVHLYLGDAYQQLGQYQQAIEDYSEAIRLKPDYASAYYNRGIVYSILGQYQQAIEDYSEAIRLKPEDVSAYYNRGIIYSKLGQYQQAIEDYSEAIRLKPEDAFAYNNRGIIYSKLGQYQQAIEDYSEAIRLKPDDAYAYKNSEAIRPKLDYASAYNNRGIVYAGLGQYEQAIKDYNEAIRLKPDNAYLYYNKACLFALRKDATQACRWLLLAIERGFNDWKQINEDKDFDNIRDTACFLDILKKSGERDSILP